MQRTNFTNNRETACVTNSKNMETMLRAREIAYTMGPGVSLWHRRPHFAIFSKHTCAFQLERFLLLLLQLFLSGAHIDHTGFWLLVRLLQFYPTGLWLLIRPLIYPTAVHVQAMKIGLKSSRLTKYVSSLLYIEQSINGIAFECQRTSLISSISSKNFNGQRRTLK